MNHPNQKSILLAELGRYPDSWVLTPVDGNKRPYRKGWQSESLLNREAIAQDILVGRAQGVGVRSGQVSQGLVCIDFDGLSALPKYLELSGGVEPPLTVGWTSGKQGRWQLAFVVPLEKWEAIATKKIPTAWDSTGKATEFLEIRWDGCQSVLPGSVHPQTGNYIWLPGQSPQECEIAQIPDRVLEAAAPEPKYQSSERVASDPTGDPWNIRNFASYLDGYRQGRRRGWITCKCPAHSGQSYDSLHIEESSGAFKCHAGCDPKDVYHAALEQAKSRGYQIPEKRFAHRFSDLGGWLFKLKQQLTKTVERRKFWGFGRKGEVEVEPTPAKTTPAIEYQPSERLQVWAEAFEQGYKYILDVSATGTGKSFDAGRATPESFKVRQLIYASAEHRNPTTPTLKSWYDLEARHKGLYRDEFSKLRRVSSNSSAAVSPNCGRNEAIAALRSKNIPGTDTAGLICQTCPNLEPCRAGKVFGFLHDRMIALKQPQLRAHPESLPDAYPDYGDPYDYSDVLLMWDEAEQIIKTHRSIKVTKIDLDRAIADLAVKLPQAFDTIRPILAALHPYLSGEQKQPRYGWKDAQIRAILPEVEGIDATEIASALAPDLDEFLNPAKEYGVDLTEMTRDIRKRFSDSDVKTAEQVSRDMALNWLPDFLDVLTGAVVGSLRIEYGTLTVTLPDRRSAEIAQAAAGNIFLDATASVEDLALKLGCDKREILVVRQALPDTSNLEIVQVGTMGRLGMSSRRKDKNGEDSLLQKRIDALIAQIQQDSPGKVAIIDFKRHTQSGDGKRHWWVDSRGSNDLAGCDTLAIVGTPCRNLSELSAEFTILYGRAPQDGTEQIKYPVQVKGQLPPDLQPYYEMEVSADPEFRDFVRRRILADIHQCFGRMRAHRRPDKQLKIFFIADYPLDLPVTLKKASDITPEAATSVERVEIAIRAAVQQLKATGQKITQQAIAATTGYSQQYISKFRVLLQTLLDGFYSKSSKNGEPPPDPDEIDFNGQIYLPLLAQESPDEIVKGMLTAFEAHGQATFRMFWDATSAATQIKILEVLILASNGGELRLLSTVVGIAA